MKQYFKEIIFLLLQLYFFYIFPLFSELYGPMEMVFVIIFFTLILSFLLGILSGKKIKFLYSIIISILFIPTIPLYYNSSALVHSLWYLVISSIGLIIGSFIRFLFQFIKKQLHCKKILEENKP